MLGWRLTRRTYYAQFRALPPTGSERPTAWADAPYKGDPGTTSVSVKMHGKDTPEETNKRDDKVIDISKMTLEPDGKTAKIVYETSCT